MSIRSRFQRGYRSCLDSIFAFATVASKAWRLRLESSSSICSLRHSAFAGSRLLAVHAPAERLVDAPHVPVKRPDLLDGAGVTVDLDPLDERVHELLARFADADSEGGGDDDLVAVVQDLTVGDFHAVEAGGHGLAPLEEALVALVFATVRHVRGLVDVDIGRESLSKVGEITLLGRRGHVDTLGSVETGQDILSSAGTV